MDLLAEAVRLNMPVTAVGGKTGLTGGAMPQGGWALSLEKLKRLEVTGDRALVGAGVLLQDLQAAVRAAGRHYGPDPTETTASLGGNIATNASGSRGFRYGATRDHVLALKVALADGRVLDIRRGDAIDFDTRAIPLPNTTKHSAGLRLAPGMDWIDLFVGSEGILGVVLEAELRLLPARKELLGGVIFFEEDEGALDAVDAWRSIEGLQMLEYFDRGSLALMEAHPTAEAALLIEQEIASEDGLDPWLDRLESSGALMEDSWFATSPRDFERFREFRHALPEKVNRDCAQSRPSESEFGLRGAGEPQSRNDGHVSAGAGRWVSRPLGSVRAHRRRALACQRVAALRGRRQARTAGDVGAGTPGGASGRHGGRRTRPRQAEEEPARDSILRRID